MPAPKDPIKYQIWKDNMSLARKGRKAWNKGRKMPENFSLKMSNISNKFWSDLNNLEKILARNHKISLSKIGDKNPMKRLDVASRASLSMKGRLLGNKNHSKKPEVRAKISKALQGHSFKPEVRAKISRTLTGKMSGSLNPFFGKHHTLEVKNKSRYRAINMIASGLLSKRRTKIELAIRLELEKRGLNFQEQTPLENITVADFYLPESRIVIYCDGDFWHKGAWAEKYHVPKKDKWQTITLQSRGYKVFRFSETEILESPATCVDNIKTIL